MKTGEGMREGAALLAFGFVSPWLLWGLAAGAVPLLIQWLHRRNYTQRVWAAMRFLRAATKAQSRKLRFESLLLLLIRTLILLLAATALAEPFLDSLPWSHAPESTVHRLIVIDTSLSLQHEVEGRSANDRARAVARKIVADSRPGDSFQLVTIDRQGQAIVRRPAYDQAEVLAELDRLEWTEQFGDVPRALQLARQILNEASVRRPVQLTLISDFQRSNWWPQSPELRTRTQRGVVDLSAVARLTLVRVGESTGVNASLGELTIDTPLVASRRRVQIAAPVRTTGPGRTVTVELVEGDVVLQTQSVDVPAGGEATVSFSEQWSETGQHGIQLRLADDGLAEDNHRWGVVDVRDVVSVLLVNGRESGETLGGATDYVELALAPFGGSPGMADDRLATGYRPVVVGEADLSRTELTDFDCVVLCDLPFLTENEAARLQSFVRSGGGLIIGLGEQVQPDAYNRWLSDWGNGLLPVRLGEVQGGETTQTEPFHFADPERGHAIVEPFAGNPQAGLTTANIYRYVRCEVDGAATMADDVALEQEAASGEVLKPRSPVGPVRVVLRYGNGDPAVLEGTYGAGRVVLVTTALDDTWGNWALWPSFLPIMHRVVQFSLEGTQPPATLVGSPLHREYPVESVGLTATIQRPDGRRTPGRALPEAGATRVTFDAAQQSGLYRIVLGPPLNDIDLLAVNVDPREGDLEYLSDTELSDTLLAGVDAQLATDVASGAWSPPAETPRSSLAGWLLLVVLVLLLIEQLMAWQPAYGLLALAVSGPLLAGLVWFPMVTTIMLLALLAGVWMFAPVWRRR